MSSEKPILFTAPMVRAILAGTKTQTRRPVKLNASGRAARGGKNWHLGDPECVKACVGTRRAGRVLDGRTWEEVPNE